MKIEIEQIDPTHFVVRCVIPRDPPFKAVEITKSAEEAAKSAKAMLIFPEHDTT